jgi:hypothetical protein
MPVLAPSETAAAPEVHPNRCERCNTNTAGLLFNLIFT